MHNTIEEIFKNLKIEPNEYFLTGSRALDTEEFKISSNISDYDYVLLITNRHKIISYLMNEKIEINFSCYNGGFKFQYNDKTYNIITPIYIEFMAWREALSILKHLINIDSKYQNAIKNKLSRYCIYEQLRGFIKTMIRLREVDK